jgi:hypothetical protein
MSGEQLHRTRAILERVSRTIEANPDASAPSIRLRAGLTRASGDSALNLLCRAGFVERRTEAAQDVYRSVRPYRASTEAPRAGFGDTHAAGQGGAS